MGLRRMAMHAHIALAERWPHFGDAGALRMRRDAGQGEGDMRAGAAERLYGEIYLGCIRTLVAGARDPGDLGNLGNLDDEILLGTIRTLVGGQRKLRVLDIGCQSGRLAIPLARDGHRVTALDIDDDWLRRCQRNARAEGVDLRLLHRPLHEAAQALPGERFDLVICTELLYVLREPVRALQVLAGLLEPGGTLLTSHRTRHYMLLTLARYRRWDDMALVVQGEEGHILGGQYYNWFELDTLHAQYSQAGLRIESALGVGVFSGMGVDGLAAVLDPGCVPASDHPRLLDIERACSALYPDAARYRLLVAKLA